MNNSFSLKYTRYLRFLQRVISYPMPISISRIHECKLSPERIHPRERTFYGLFPRPNSPAGASQATHECNPTRKAALPVAREGSKMAQNIVAECQESIFMRKKEQIIISNKCFTVDMHFHRGLHRNVSVYEGRQDTRKVGQEKPHGNDLVPPEENPREVPVITTLRFHQWIVTQKQYFLASDGEEPSDCSLRNELRKKVDIKELERALVAPHWSIKAVLKKGA
ncbi:unnamed protein product [Nesidiocoris tenuis]|uniref:Uncharacterized protein n=1 Tax=Nesidiocoris tenuis TaxID=355587 RepID=A0A6H5HA07_9HEMI|nr:unnamed protein product [Nesidiocoris tenuis]